MITKENKAITLVALIITIIILLILAGVSINFIFGNEGIFSKTQYAVEQYKNAQEKENYILAQTQEMINSRDSVVISKEEYEKIINRITSLESAVNGDNGLNVKTKTLEDTKAENYSTKEKIIGTWIDEKPLYQITITGLNISMSWINQNLTQSSQFTALIDDVDTIVNVSAIQTSAGTNWTTSAINLVNYGSKWMLQGIENHPVTGLTIQYTKK